MSEKSEPDIPILNDHCVANFISEKGLKINIGRETMATSEKERGASSHKELMLTLTTARKSREQLNNSVQENNKIKEDPLILKAQDNGYAKI